MRRDDDDLAGRFRALSPWLERRLSARLRGQHGHDIEGLVQESFIRLARYSVSDRSRHPKALLMRIAGNLARDGHRAEARRGLGHHQPLDEAPAQSLRQESDPELLFDIKAAVLGLPAPLRDVFVLARFTPLTHAQIGERLGISPKTVEWRLAKALALCADRLGLGDGGR